MSLPSLPTSLSATSQLASDTADEQYAAMAEEAAIAAGEIVAATLTPARCATLWVEVERLAREIPYCYNSRYYALSDAAEEVGRMAGIPGWVGGLPLAAQCPDCQVWLAFVEERFAGKSQYAGD